MLSTCRSLISILLYHIKLIDIIFEIFYMKPQLYVIVRYREKLMINIIPVRKAWNNTGCNGKRVQGDKKRLARTKNVFETALIFAYFN